MVRVWIRLIACALICFVLPGGESASAPTKENYAKEHVLEGWGSIIQSFELKGQEETRIIASGETALYLGLYVFDAHGNCVAFDDYAGTHVREDAAVIFVPPVQGAYTVEVRSFFGRDNKVRLVVR
jgi:hypothetical protein